MFLRKTFQDLSPYSDFNVVQQVQNICLLKYKNVFVCFFVVFFRKLIMICLGDCVETLKLH